jgi:crotonobetaine/carnitine-CoA ligase
VRYQGNWTIGELVDDRAERWPGEVAISSERGDLTFGALRERARSVAAGLRELGLEPGDRVATMLDSSVDYLAAWQGIAWAGAVDVPLNVELKATFLHHVLRDSGARVLIVEARWAARLEGLELPELEHVITVDAPAAELAGRAWHRFEHLLGRPGIDLVRRERTDPVYILYTSGTTGPSKGVVHTNGSACQLTQGYLENLDLGRADVGYSMFPLSHVMGRGAMATTALWAGCRMVLRERFSASGFWDDIRATGTTYFGYFGAVILFLWRQEPRPDDADNPVRLAFGASAPPELMDDWERRFGLDLCEVYGSTELGLAACSPPGRRKAGTMGKPVSYIELAIHGDDDRPLPAGEIGQIVARPRRPEAFFASYWNRPGWTLEAFRNLWFHAGDAGSIDADGYLTFSDRLKDSIRRRGENISSFEVEEAVRTHPGVVECAAFPVPSEHGDDEVMIAIILERPDAFEPERFCHDLVELIPRYAIPRYIRVVAEFPKTPTQRVQKFKLRDEGVTADTVDREALGVVPARE